MDALGRENYILKKVGGFAKENRLLLKHGKIICAVSGGPDSVALLHMLLRLRDEFLIHVGACHVEHGIRGESSIEDMDFVAGLCKKWDVPLIIRHLDPKIYQSAGMETAARDARRAIFSELLSRGASAIALGHHRDDQAETVLMRLARGSRGSLGMRPHAEGIIRPLLCISKGEILQYLEENDIPFRIDETNNIPDNPRNRIRLHVMPELEAAYPKAAEAIARAAAYACEDDDYLNNLAEQWLSTEQSAPPENAVLRRVIALQAKWMKLGDKLTQILIRRVMSLYREGRTGGRVYCGNGFWEKRKDGSVYTDSVGHAALAELPLAIPGETCFGRNTFITKLLPQWNNSFPSGKSEQLFDAGKLPPLTIRYRKPGDFMHPLGMEGRKKLQDIMTDRAFPKALRSKTPLLAHESEVFWMPGLPPSNAAKVTPDTNTFLLIQYKEEE